MTFPHARLILQGMDSAAVLAGCYGVVSIAGGVLGYVNAKSRASLLAGTIAGTALLVCAVGLARGAAAAEAGTLAVSALLAARFFGSWRRRRRVMPDLLMWGLGAATIAAVVLRRLLKA